MNAKLPQAVATHVWRSEAGLGRAVRAARMKAGLTASDLASRARVGRKFLHELEGGKSTLRVDKLLDVLEILGLRLLVMAPRRSGPASARVWLRRNRAALEAYNEHIEKDGVFSEGLRSF